MNRYHVLFVISSIAVIGTQCHDHTGTGDPLDWLRDSIPGEPGVDYPIYGSIIPTSFSCASRVFGGYYADVEMQCQGYHICLSSVENSDERQSFLCQNGTLFNQELLTCDWWFNVDCTKTENFYSINENLGVTDKIPSRFQADSSENPARVTPFGQRFNPEGNRRQPSGTSNSETFFDRQQTQTTRTGQEKQQTSLNNNNRGGSTRTTTTTITETNSGVRSGGSGQRTQNNQSGGQSTRTTVTTNQSGGGKEQQNSGFSKKKTVVKTTTQQSQDQSGVISSESIDHAQHEFPNSGSNTLNNGFTTHSTRFQSNQQTAGPRPARPGNFEGSTRKKTTTKVVERGQINGGNRNSIQTKTTNQFSSGTRNQQQTTRTKTRPANFGGSTRTQTTTTIVEEGGQINGGNRNNVQQTKTTNQFSSGTRNQHQTTQTKTRPSGFGGSTRTKTVTTTTTVEEGQNTSFSADRKDQQSSSTVRNQSTRFQQNKSGQGNSGAFNRKKTSSTTTVKEQGSRFTQKNTNRGTTTRVNQQSTNQRGTGQQGNTGFTRAQTTTTTVNRGDEIGVRGQQNRFNSFGKRTQVNQQTTGQTQQFDQRKTGQQGNSGFKRTKTTTTTVNRGQNRAGSTVKGQQSKSSASGSRRTQVNQQTTGQRQQFGQRETGQQGNTRFSETKTTTTTVNRGQNRGGNNVRGQQTRTNTSGSQRTQAKTTGQRQQFGQTGQQGNTGFTRTKTTTTTVNRGQNRGGSSVRGHQTRTSATGQRTQTKTTGQSQQFGQTGQQSNTGFNRRKTVTTTVRKEQGNRGNQNINKFRGSNQSQRTKVNKQSTHQGQTDSSGFTRTKTTISEQHGQKSRNNIVQQNKNRNSESSDVRRTQVTQQSSGQNTRFSSVQQPGPNGQFTKVVRTSVTEEEFGSNPGSQNQGQFISNQQTVTDTKSSTHNFQDLENVSGPSSGSGFTRTKTVVTETVKNEENPGSSGFIVVDDNKKSSTSNSRNTEKVTFSEKSGTDGLRRVTVIKNVNGHVQRYTGIVQPNKNTVIIEHTPESHDAREHGSIARNNGQSDSSSILTDTTVKYTKTSDGSIVPAQDADLSGTDAQFIGFTSRQVGTKFTGASPIKDKTVSSSTYTKTETNEQFSTGGEQVPLLPTGFGNEQVKNGFTETKTVTITEESSGDFGFESKILNGGGNRNPSVNGKSSNVVSEKKTTTFTPALGKGHRKGFNKRTKTVTTFVDGKKLEKTTSAFQDEIDGLDDGSSSPTSFQSITFDGQKRRNNVNHFGGPSSTSNIKIFDAESTDGNDGIPLLIADPSNVILQKDSSNVDSVQGPPLIALPFDSSSFGDFEPPSQRSNSNGKPYTLYDVPSFR